jgi:hypothetical protein
MRTPGSTALSPWPPRRRRCRPPGADRPQSELWLLLFGMLYFSGDRNFTGNNVMIPLEIIRSRASRLQCSFIFVQC